MVVAVLAKQLPDALAWCMRKANPLLLAVVLCVTVCHRSTQSAAPTVTSTLRKVMPPNSVPW